jgi:hypothetical protein
MNYTEKCKWLADFYREAAETGRPMESLRGNGEWISCENLSPGFHSNPSQWRLKPEPQKAWVVWDGDECRMLSSIKLDAEEYAKQINGTIQEITRPDK